MRKTKLIIASLSAALGIGALVATPGLKGVVEAKAATENVNAIRVYVEDQLGGAFNWTYDNGNAFMHMTSITFTSGSGYTSLSDIKTDAFGASMTIGSNYIDVEMSWVSGGSNRPYEVKLPWYINSFTGVFYAADSSRQLCEQNGGARVTINATVNHEYKIYAGNWTGKANWYNGIMYADTSVVTENTYSYAETTYSVTISKSGTGTVSPSSGTYKKNQILTLTATPSDGWSFSGWSDSGSQIHKIYVTATTTYTATFLQIPALSTPVLSKDASNNVTWTAVSNATKYQYSFDNSNWTDVATSATLRVDAKLAPNSYTVYVKAIGDHVSYNDSAVASVNYTVADGYFLVGQFQSWDTADLVGALRMTTSDAGKTYSVDITTTSANVQVKAIYRASGGAERWQAVKDNTVENNPFADSSYNAEFYENNVKLPKQGTYTITIEPVEGNLYQSAYKSSVPSETFTLYVGTTEYAMTYHEGNEFKAIGVVLSHGDTLSYKRGSTTVSDSTAKVIYNNNIDVSKKVVFNAANANVYVDVVAKTIWAEGNSATGGYHLLQNGVLRTMTHNEKPSDPSFLEYYSDLLTFAVNDSIRFVDVKAEGEVLPVVFDITTINTGGVGSKFTVADGRIKCVTAGNASVYMKLKSGDDEVYFGTVSEALEKAEEFAKSFTDAMDAVCLQSAGGTTDVTALRNAWQSKKTYFNGTLIEGAQTILKDATTGHTVEAIRNFISSYMFIASKYMTQLGDGYNFLQKEIPSSVAINPITIGDSSEFINYAIIAASGMLILVEVSFLLLKRRKKNIK